MATSRGCLYIASAAQAGALAIGIATAVSMPSLLMMGAGVGVTLLALLLVRREAKDQVAAAATATASSTVSAEAQYSSEPAAADASRSSPPLPFLGNRISIGHGAGDHSSLADAAARASRMSVMKRHGWAELMSRVSHELRTPLNAVIGFSDVMNEELLGPVGHPRYREYARHIRDCGRELLKSAEDTLAITCLLDHQEGRRTSPSLEFASVARDAWAFCADTASRRGVGLELVGHEDVELVGERRPLRQILINLFSEAIERAGRNGEVTLTASVSGDLAQIEVSVRGAHVTHRGEASLAVCLARALLEMQGAPLVELDDPSCSWRVVTVLGCAVQADFFELGAPTGPSATPVHAC